LLRIEADTQSSARPRVGQGRVVDAKRRKAIELAAMDRAKSHYELLGWQVEDTSAYRPYDLECRRGDSDVLRVEVKGLTQGVGTINVTVGEVNQARDPSVITDLFIVANIGLSVDDDGALMACMSSERALLSS